jgi:hypothetical protein
MQEKTCADSTFFLLTPDRPSGMVSKPTNTGEVDDTAREKAQILGDVPHGAEIPN